MGLKFSIYNRFLDDAGAPGLRPHFENHDFRVMLLKLKYMLNHQKYS